MKNDLSCGVVRDLLPSYAEGLTGEDSRAAIEKHLEECPDCREIYGRMTAPETPAAAPEEQREVDYLRRLRRRGRRRVLLAIASVLLLAGIAAFTAVFVVGRPTPASSLSWQAEVAGDRVDVSGFLLDSGLGCRSLSWQESAPGQVELTVKSALISPLSSGSFSGEYQASAPVERVLLDGLVIWEGQTVSRRAALIYNCVHDYVGDVSANAELAQAIGVYDRLGYFTWELHTEAEPYGCTLTLEEEVSPSIRSGQEELMRACACLLLAGIGNLEQVEWSYGSGGEQLSLTVDREQASYLLGREVKDCALSAAGVQQALDILSAQAALDGLPAPVSGQVDIGYALPDDSFTDVFADGFGVIVFNDTDAEIYGLEIDCRVDGESRQGGGGINADGSPLYKGESMTFILSELGPGAFAGHERAVYLSVTDKEGRSHRLEQEIPISVAGSGRTYAFVLRGDFEQGFTLSPLE